MEKGDQEMLEMKLIKPIFERAVDLLREYKKSLDNNPMISPDQHYFLMGLYKKRLGYQTKRTLFLQALEEEQKQ